MSEHDEDDGQAHRTAQDNYAAEVEAREEAFPEDRRRDLSNALYTFNERGFFYDDLEISPENALKVWALVERVKAEGFSDDLRM